MLARCALAVVVIGALVLGVPVLLHGQGVQAAGLADNAGLAHNAGLADNTGNVLGVVGRQVAWLNLVAPRPQLLTQFVAPAYATDVATLPAMPGAVVAVIEAFPGQSTLGGDLLRLELSAHTLSPLVARTTPTESLGSPAWTPDGSRLLFDRADLSATPIQYPGQSAAYYPSRIEAAQADGAGRGLVVNAGRMPAVSPDGTHLAYLRSTTDGTALLVRALAGSPAPSAGAPDDTQEQVLVPATRFVNLAYPRYSPRGDRIAFMAPGTFVARSDWTASLPFAPSVAYAHGTPWDLWVVGADGTNLEQLAELGADDASVSWSPDGTRILVYGGSGSSLVDPQTAEIDALPYLSGYGSTAWLPRADS